MIYGAMLTVFAHSPSRKLLLQRLSELLFFELLLSQQGFFGALSRLPDGQSTM